jgi:hypothetical protein
MKGALAFAAVSEAVAGLALLIAPALVGQLLLGRRALEGICYLSFLALRHTWKDQ